MTTLGDIAALAGRRITAMWRSPAKVIGVLMMPISMVLVLGYLFDGSIALPDGQRYVDYLTAGVAVQVGLACVATSALGIADDLRGGLADRFRSLPIRRSAVLFGHTISELSLVAVGIAATSGIAALLGWRIHASPLSAIAGFALLLLFSYGMLWVGVLIGLSIRGTEAISSTAAMIMVFGSFVSNAFVPLRGLPDWLATVSAWNPVSSVVAACRTLWGNPTVVTGTGFAEQHATLIAVAVLALVLLVTVTASSRVYRRAVAG
ncbi:ABC transporter permease [Amycolatopsis sp. CA-230715]|uniref:ABC transporter permease n=1 Tax=Amycolatopsis sp. CA-230715 TaxID=2745196 RepID=UPI001C00A243|nr:ABC transporter permease [Amycolatopsis sp. CA-230715]QWF85104.1 hypothetical protein HUW46_08558 [Amycolatopsis sp. CA-230715]